MKEILDFIEKNGPSTSKEIIEGLKKKIEIEGNLVRKNLSLMKGRQDVQTLPIAGKGGYVSLYYRPPQQLKKAIEKSKFNPLPLEKYRKVPQELISKPETEKIEIDAKFERYFARLKNQRTRGPAMRVLENLVTAGTSESLEPINRTLNALKSSKFDEIKFDLYSILYHLCHNAVEEEILEGGKIKEIALIMYETVTSESVHIKEKRKAFNVWRVLKTEEHIKSLLEYCWTTIETEGEEYEKESRIFMQEIISWIIKINGKYKQEIEDDIWESLKKIKDENIRKRYEALLNYPLDIF